MSDPPLTAGDFAERIVAALRGGDPVVSAVVVEAADGAVPVGARILVSAAERVGTSGDVAVDDGIAAAARELLHTGAAGTCVLGTGERHCTVYLEPHRPPPALVIVGAGHIARPLCATGALLGFAVTVLDDRAEFATHARFPEAERVIRADWSNPFAAVETGNGTHLVLVTRGHKYDFEALRQLLTRPEQPAYIGMVGSRRRVRAALEQLAHEGIPTERLRQIHAPVGLDIGAETPAEIAVAIAAELVQARRGGSGAPLRNRERVVERWVGGDRRNGGRLDAHDHGAS